jgi:hypothetical protein
MQVGLALSCGQIGHLFPHTRLRGVSVALLSLITLSKFALGFPHLEHF